MIPNLPALHPLPNNMQANARPRQAPPAPAAGAQWWAPWRPPAPLGSCPLSPGARRRCGSHCILYLTSSWADGWPIGGGPAADERPAPTARPLIIITSLSTPPHPPLPDPLTPQPRRAERSSDGGFTAGFVMGGVVFGALGFLFAPQVRALSLFPLEAADSSVPSSCTPILLPNAPLTHPYTRTPPPPSPPQISRALLGDDQRIRLPRFMEEEGPKDPEATKQDLIDKIAQVGGCLVLCTYSRAIGRMTRLLYTQSSSS
jgi:hypothetical protein